MHFILPASDFPIDRQYHTACKYLFQMSHPNHPEGHLESTPDMQAYVVSEWTTSIKFNTGTAKLPPTYKHISYVKGKGTFKVLVHFQGFSTSSKHIVKCDDNTCPLQQLNYM